MKNYSAMSDFEINKSVALLCCIEGVCINDDGFPVKNIIDDSPGSYSGGDYIEYDFDPCNSWADAGPIIQENKISLTFSKSDCVATKIINDGARYRESYGENPLRAAMIVFLMMKDAE